MEIYAAECDTNDKQFFPIKWCYYESCKVFFLNVATIPERRGLSDNGYGLVSILR